jgi:spore germination cell wall hydrolase CwlJ-like protein
LVAGLRSARVGLARFLAGIVLLFLSAAEGGLERGIECVALNISFEARFEPEEGRRAVAHVVLNRAADRRWADTPCRVVAEGHPEAGPLCQFSWYCDALPNTPARNESWHAARRLAGRVYWGRSHDPTDGALWYHADYVNPKWRYGLRRGRQIGRHIFYHDPLPPEGPGNPPI